MKRVVLLGSTGSIGTSSLSIIDSLSDKFQVVGLGAGKNIKLLCDQARKYRPAIVGVETEELADDLSRDLSPLNIGVVFGMAGLIELAEHKADLVINGLAGSIGLIPTIRAIESGKDVAMANKESLVMMGDILMEEAKEHGVNILPVDSEPAGIWQCLENHPAEQVHKIILTASGGPFVDLPKEEFEKITPQRALCHPTWKMGSKITIDSATLMNKGLEVIEACCLFGMSPSSVEVLVHRQSVVHSLVEFVDGSLIAQLSQADMRLPIQYALTYPDRLPAKVPSLDLASLGKLTFEKPDLRKFLCLELCYEAARIGGTAPAALNAANEVAVDAFLGNRIGFTDIPKINRIILESHSPKESPLLEDVLESDNRARNLTRQMMENLS